MDARHDHARGRRLALVGLVVNVGLAAVKLVAGLLGHSYALVADAVESLVDIAGSAVIWGGLKLGAKPPDEDHPYGHGRAEAIAGLVVSMMVVTAGLGIAVQAVSELVTPHRTPAPFTLWVLVAVVVVKEGMFRIVRGAGRELGSGAMHVDAWHHRSDAITSLAAFIGIGISLTTGYAQADDIAALFASGVILYNGVRLFLGPMHELMDKEPSDVIERARCVALGVPGVVNTEKMAARTLGSRHWIDMHLRVDPDMTVRDAHALAHRVKDAIRREVPRIADVLVHVEPAGPSDAAGGSEDHPSAEPFSDPDAPVGL